MERKDFLKNSIGILSAATLVDACKKSDTSGTTTSTTTTGSCTVTNSETDGPYPLYTSRGSAIVRTDITEGTKTGTPLNITLTVVNVKNNCAVLAGVVVDIWHCDKDGYYSGYSSQPGYLGTLSYPTATWLRGRQTTDSNGQVKFTSIYPGWYTGRMTHIHVQVYTTANSSSAGSSNSIITTQIAFPDAITQAVYATSLYSAHGQNTITFSGDSVFSDGTSTEMAVITANSSTGGYDLSFTVDVSA